MSRENYMRSMEIENFLRRVLNPKSTRVVHDLKDFYQSIVFYEEGYVKISKSQHEKHFARLLRYFDKAMDKLITAQNCTYVKELQREMDQMTSSEDIWWLFGEVKKLEGERKPKPFNNLP